MLASLQYAALKTFCKHAKILAGAHDRCTRQSKLDLYFPHVWRDAVKDRSVIDFGCGPACELIEMAHAGATTAYGIEISPRCLQAARERIAASDVADRCHLLTSPSCDPVDVIFSFDSFEHFAQPGAILSQMYALLKPGGTLFISFGPTWLHPYGGHAFSPFPWAHLLCPESALVQWRNAHFPGTSIGINSSGLNRITIRHFLSLCQSSPFTMVELSLVPIRPLKLLHNSLTREFTTSVVRTILRK